MKEDHEVNEIMGRRCIWHEVWRHVRHSITYLLRGLEGIAAVAQFGEKAVPATTNFRLMAQEMC
jgi:hypothetical protein